jgi:hypothetical protein
MMLSVIQSRFPLFVISASLSGEPISQSSDLTESSNLLHKVLIFTTYIKDVNESVMQHPATQPTSTGEAPEGPLLVDGLTKLIMV